MNEPLSLSDLKALREKALQVMAKYDNDFGELHTVGTKEDVHTVMIYLVNDANHQQRVVAGLDKE
ncbi:hypothetical protein [Lactiplantibacillus fabifermentans]|uniref:Uncharacterized protein n=2 Tax=Lactiplantibacillus fabifermentans TaxID=483011 RepID=A0A0R2NSH8_9LACO|nr:hypothetical protein [Lactiplantibacillus fabifermentans]ETY73290.1 hypothetical protein LFAB_13180 [Lactiplantibacillus fabifermentans T30PCM01]KRO28348.1 hypothetical protein DY78_GL002478 [Lactiplantibacillus fabifermentans DSM 21115]